MHHKIVWIAALGMLFGCGSEDLEETGDDTAVDDTPAYTADWTGVVELLNAECAQCHAVGSPTGPGIVLEEAIWNDLADSANALVVPGDPEASELWDRLIGGPSGDSMPWGGALLDAEKIAHVEQWILDGALVP